MPHWTYSGDPNLNTKDAVRFLIQDTDSNRQLANDEEICWTLEQEANIYMAGAIILEIVARRLSGSGISSKKVGDLSLTYRSSSELLLESAKLRSRGQAQYQEITAGGISRSEKDTHEQDTDIEKLDFKKGIHDFPLTTSQDNDEEQP